MHPRDEFAAATKEKIARRVGYRCSAPACRAATLGPTDDPDKAANVGVAAHITAAAEGGPRYDAELTSAQRRAAENGIWLCQIHAKQVDGDVERFTVDLLREWKVLAEAHALSDLGVPHQPAPVHMLPGNDVEIRFTGDYQAVHSVMTKFHEDVGLRAAWGDQLAEKAYYLMYELVINAFEHGKASKVDIGTEGFDVRFGYEGVEFGLAELADSGSGGGTAALEAFQQEESGTLEVVHEWQDGYNEWTIVDIRMEDREFFPCGVRLASAGEWQSRIEKLDGCDEVHLYLDGPFSMSDAKRLPPDLVEALEDKRLVVHGASNWPAIRDYLEKSFPGMRFAS